MTICVPIHILNPTDWVKSELMETLHILCHNFTSNPTDWVKSELMETNNHQSNKSRSKISLPIGLNRN
ncbi:hypothetical protein [Nostoc sp. 'Peltigera membranacea cyanobiont' 232]|uniref:hypothetical protein n=1 Tax=Nostoc sp. 'Peltigera membranacea cyanobiont' 232 TaxID=2014531 RepID=UPI003FA583D9